LEAHLEELFEEEEAHPPQVDKEDVPKERHKITELPTAEDEGLIKNNAAESDWISRAGRQDRSFESGYRKRTSDSRVSKTDPDATPMTWAKSGSRLGYQVYNVVDGGKARIILNVVVTPSEVTENRPMLDLLWSTIDTPTPRTVVPSTAHGTRTTTTGCAPTARPSPTRKPYERGRCGSSPCSPRPKTGTGREGLGCGGSKR
jgi:hypothetical protein